MLLQKWARENISQRLCIAQMDFDTQMYKKNLWGVIIEVLRCCYNIILLFTSS